MHRHTGRFVNGLTRIEMHEVVALNRLETRFSSNAKNNRRWVVNVAAVFGAIHFYTQWFELLGANPLSVLSCGLVTLGLAMGLWKLNLKLFGVRLKNIKFHVCVL